MRHLEVWRAAWAEQVRQPSVGVQSHETEFLPAALEVQDTPPSPLGRAVSVTIMAVFLCAALWATFGKIDIVAVAQGKIIPSGHSKVIQPLESGVIKAIRVRDGQAVAKGDVLLELDPTQTGAEEERLANEFRAAKAEAARLRALIAGQDVLEMPPGSASPFVALQQQLLRDQLAEQRAKVAAALHQVDQRKAAIEATRADITRLEATVPMQTQRAQAYKKLLDDKYVAEMQYLEAEQQRIEKVQELEAQRQKLIQDTAALAEAQKQYQRVIAEFQQTRQTELAATETRAASLAQELVKAGQRTGLQTLIAPIDGVVQQLAVHTVGGVVTPAQQLMVVVPQGHQLEVEALVENKDIGFVKEGQPAEIKIEAFPFTIYGVINGTVVSVSDDAVPLEKGGLVYAARVSMERVVMPVEDKEVRLSPGMAVTVEIKTGTRRLVEFFLSPLLKSLKETARER